MTAPTRFPLAWPAGRPRTRSRRAGKFTADGRAITPTVAINRLSRELELLGAVYPVLSTDYPVRLDGTLILNRGAPTDPGACAYFQLKGAPYALACDTYADTAQNIAAIAAHVESTRAIERHGVATAGETLQAFQALPAPPAWHEVLAVSAAARAAEITQAYRRAAVDAHPDRPGGSHDRMATLTAARDEGLRLAQERTR